MRPPTQRPPTQRRAYEAPQVIPAPPFGGSPRIAFLMSAWDCEWLRSHRRVEQTVARRSTLPEVAGSSPAAATPLIPEALKSPH